MKRKIVAMGLMGGLAVSLLFNNCTPQHDGNMGDSFSVAKEVAFAPCAFKDEMDLFDKTYHTFTTQHCSACHVEGGEGKGAFASSGLLVAYNNFSVVGYEKISQYAVDTGHKPPYTGPDNQGSIDFLKIQWAAGLTNIADCKGGVQPVDPIPPDDADRVRTKSKGINAPDTGEYATLTWNLGTELLDQGKPLPQVPGVSIKIRVRRITLAAKPMYEISLPMVSAGASDIKLQSILIQLNGKTIPNQTTFRYVDEGIYAGTTDYLLAPGAMVADGAISPTDVMSLSIGSIEAVTLPERPPLPTVGFEGPTMTVPERGVAQVNLVLSEANTSQYVTVTVGISTIGDPNLLAKNRRSQTIRVNNMNKVIDRWDWDYSIDTQAVVFAPGETRKALNLTIADDQRVEQNEQITVVINSAVNANKSTSTVLTMTIQDDDVPDVSGAPTFSELMAPTGILFKNCIECHNSVDNRGGYNLSDYDWMIKSEVLIPGDNASKMYVRMNSQTSGVPPMPLGGLLEATDRRMVERWILGGAKNN